MEDGVGTPHLALSATAPRTLAALLQGQPGALEVRILSLRRSMLTPQFYNNTGVSVVRGVDYTYDVEVADSVEKVRLPRAPAPPAPRRSKNQPQP